MSFVIGPIAPQNNPPIEPQFFQPSVFKITAISTGIITTVTTAPAFGVDNNYVIGQQVRFNIPSFYGIPQLNGQDAFVVGLPGANQFTVSVNSTKYNAFISSPPYGPTAPQVAAMGDVNTGPINTGRTNNGLTIEGTFINISPAAGG